MPINMQEKFFSILLHNQLLVSTLLRRKYHFSSTLKTASFDVLSTSLMRLRSQFTKVFQSVNSDSIDIPINIPQNPSMLLSSS